MSENNEFNVVRLQRRIQFYLNIYFNVQMIKMENEKKKLKN